MAKNEDREFELILGNHQLLSVFFIVVILLGVFFTMGYIVGRNSAPTGTDVASARKAETKPLVVDSPARQQDQTPSVPGARPTETAARQPAAAEQEPESVKEAKSEAARAGLVRASNPAGSGGQPAAGQTYLQLAATNKPDADIMVDVLRQKGFKALAAEIPEKPGMFRVLVGPVIESVVNKIRAELQGAGFPGNAAIKKTF